MWNTWIFQIGEFVMEKKDIKNLETYPIWKIESGRMLHKFELFTEDSRILHRAIPTVSFPIYDPLAQVINKSILYMTLFNKSLIRVFSIRPSSTSR